MPESLPDLEKTATRESGLRFVVIGLALICCGVAAIMLPELSTAATGKLLGSIVTIAGAVVVLQSLRDTGWVGFRWQLLFGSAEIVGGILIVLNPLKGAAALTLLLVVVMVAQAGTQLGLALKIRPAPGWWWLAGASLMTFLIGAGLLWRFPYSVVESPGEKVGVAMTLVGAAFLLIGFGWLRLRREATP
jgi:uncharacterized membrane protein HdeD (DUF308 family)